MQNLLAHRRSSQLDKKPNRPSNTSALRTKSKSDELTQKTISIPTCDENAEDVDLRQEIKSTLMDEYPGLDYFGAHQVLMTKKRWYCAIWFLCLLACITGSIIAMFKVTREYMDPEQAIATHVYVQPVTLLMLPKVTVCMGPPERRMPINKARFFSKIKEVASTLPNNTIPDGDEIYDIFLLYLYLGSGFSLYSHLGELHVDDFSNSSTTYDRYGHFTTLYDKWRGNRSPKEFFRYFYEEFGIPCQDVFSFCKLNGRPFKCCSVFKPTYTMSHGLCFTTNTTLTQRAYNDLAPLIMGLKAWPNYYFPAQISKQPIFAVSLTAHDKKEVDSLPHYIVTRKKVLQLKLSAKKIEQRNDCDSSNSKLGKSFQYLNALFEKVERILSCTLPYMEQFNADRNVDFEVCHPSKILQLTMGLSIKDRTEFNAEDALLNHASVLPCDRWEYTVQDSLISLNHYTGRSRQENTSPFLVKIFFNELQYEVLKQVSTLSFYGLLAQIGGQLSLFLGTSILTTVQLMAMSVIICRKMLQRWLRHRRHRTGTVSAHSMRSSTVQVAPPIAVDSAIGERIIAPSSSSMSNNRAAHPSMIKTKTMSPCLSSESTAPRAQVQSTVANYHKV